MAVKTHEQLCDEITAQLSEALGLVACIRAGHARAGLLLNDLCGKVPYQGATLSIVCEDIIAHVTGDEEGEWCVTDREGKILTRHVKAENAVRACQNKLGQHVTWLPE